MLRQSAAGQPSTTYQPIPGIRTPGDPVRHPLKHFLRAARILHVLRGTRLGTCLDVGGAEGWAADLVRRACGADVCVVDRDGARCRRARAIFGHDAARADAVSLPFADGTFDLVMCNEVIEHVEDPVLVALELTRVARRYVLVSTAATHPSRVVITLQRMLTDRASGGHRNWFSEADLTVLLGRGTRAFSEYFIPGPG